MLAVVALIIFVVAIVMLTTNPLPEKIFGGHDYPEIQAIQEEIHRYSGVDEDYYMEYYTKMDMAKRTHSSFHARNAVESLRNVALMVEQPDSSVPTEINDLADKLLVEWLKQ